MAEQLDKIVVLVDMDCFYCQVEEQEDPTLKGKPVAVVQYNEWRGGGIIAVNYAAKAEGVTRHMRGAEAREKCPSIALVKVPNKAQKADISKYREAGKRVAEVLQTFTQILERASVDEAYMDITQNVNDRINSLNSELSAASLAQTYAIGYESMTTFLDQIYHSDDYNSDDQLIRLAVAGCIVSEVRKAVKDKTGYECSAGISHNKILAKLACGINKPNKQTILPQSQVDKLFSKLPVKKITGLGGKFGDSLCDVLGITYMGELLQFTEKHLQERFNEKNGSWLYNMARGVDLEPVTQRLTTKSIGSCKKFPGRSALTGMQSLKHWLTELSNDIAERLQTDIIENSRKARQLVVSFTQEVDGKDIASSRTAQLTSYESEKIASDSLEVIKKATPNFSDKNNESLIALPIKFLGISVGKFEQSDTKARSIDTFFNRMPTKCDVLENSVQNVKSTNISTENISSLDLKLKTSTNVSDVLKILSSKDVSKCPNDSDMSNEDHIKHLEESFIDFSYCDTGSSTIRESETLIGEKSDTPITGKKIVDMFKNHPTSRHNSSVLSTDSAVPQDLKEMPLNTTKSFFMKYFQQQKEINTMVDNHSSNENNQSLNSVNNINENIIDACTNALSDHNINTDDSNSSGAELLEILKQSNTMDNCEHSTRLDISVTNINDFSNDTIHNVTDEQDPSDENDSINQIQFTNVNEEKCPECDELINMSEKVSHSDFHIALRLSIAEHKSALQQCPECNKHVLNLIEHLDHHLAFKISQEQRDEFRQSRLQQYKAIPVSEAKSAKPKTTSKRKPDSGTREASKKYKSITAFFNKR